MYIYLLTYIYSYMYLLTFIYEYTVYTWLALKNGQEDSFIHSTSYIYVYIYIYIYTYKYIHIYMYMYMYVLTYIYSHMYLLTFIYKYTVYTWLVLKNGQEDPTIKSTSKQPYSFKLDPYALILNNDYSFQLTVLGTFVYVYT
jgi:hypothetical protein